MTQPEYKEFSFQSHDGAGLFWANKHPLEITACSGVLKKIHQSIGFRERQQEILGSCVRREMILQCLSALSWRSLLVSACVINNIIASVQLDSANGASEAHNI